MQPERLNPTGALSTCDSPTSTTKGAEVGRNDLSLFLRGNNAGSGIQQVARSIKGNASRMTFGFKTYAQQESKEVICCHFHS